MANDQKIQEYILRQYYQPKNLRGERLFDITGQVRLGTMLLLGLKKTTLLQGLNFFSLFFCEDVPL